MLFTSANFVFAFLPLAVCGFFLIGRWWQSGAVIFLALVSFAFYMLWAPAQVPILVASALFNYACGTWLATAGTAKSEPVRRLVLYGALLGNLGLLGWFKYAGFFGGIIAQVTGTSVPLPAILLPLGISFYTFTQIAFVVDCYRREVGHWPLPHYLLFVSYFPHLIAGPILHHAELIPQFRDNRVFRPTAENFAVGLTIFVIGLSKKMLIADKLAPFVSETFAENVTSPGAAQAWGAALAYTMQLYFDFSGYSDMAIGLSRLFGISLPVNFDSPYKASSVIEFWRRWHMTLSRFLRDYLYIPLGGNRHGAPRKLANLGTTMLLGGLWHGAGWTFVVWGGLHAVYLVANHLWRRVRPHLPVRPSRAEAIAGWALTFVSVLVAWVFFRAPHMDSACGILAGMIGLHGLGPIPSAEWLSWLAGASVLALAFPNTMQIMAGFHSPPPGQTLRNAASAPALRWQPKMRWAVVVFTLIAACAASVGQTTEFLYFQF